MELHGQNVVGRKLEWTDGRGLRRVEPILAYFTGRDGTEWFAVDMPEAAEPWLVRADWDQMVIYG